MVFRGNGAGGSVIPNRVLRRGGGQEIDCQLTANDMYRILLMEESVNSPIVTQPKSSYPSPPPRDDQYRVYPAL